MQDNHKPPPLAPESAIPTLPPVVPPIPEIQTTPRRLSAARSKSQKGRGWMLVSAGIAIGLVAAAFFAWPMISDQIDGQKGSQRPSEEWSSANAQQRAALKWIQENEGDPASVEIIRLEGPRSTTDGSIFVRAKYRATNRFGAAGVSDKGFQIVGDKAVFDPFFIRIWGNLLPVETDHGR